MALINCIECGKEISSLAVSCPHCGCPREYQSKDINTDKRDTNTGIREVDPIWNDAMNSVLGGSKLGGMKIIREATGISLREAYDIVTHIDEYKELPKDLPKTKNDLHQKGYRKPQILISICDSCDNIISSRAEICPHCGHKTGVHVCPRCNSIDTEVFSGTDKAISILLLGRFATHNVMSRYWCRDCGHKW